MHLWFFDVHPLTYWIESHSTKLGVGVCVCMCTLWGFVVKKKSHSFRDHVISIKSIEFRSADFPVFRDFLSPLNLSTYPYPLSKLTSCVNCNVNFIHRFSNLGDCNNTAVCLQYQLLLIELHIKY